MVNFMADVQFDEPQYASAVPAAPQGPSGLAGLVIKTGCARDEAGATKVLLGLAALALIAALAVFFSTGVSHTVPLPPVP